MQNMQSSKQWISSTIIASQYIALCVTRVGGQSVQHSDCTIHQGLDALRTDLICNDIVCLHFCANAPRLSEEWTQDLFCNHNICPAILHNPRQYCAIQQGQRDALCTDWTLDLFCSARTCVCILAHFTKVQDIYKCISFANNHSWPYCLWELAPPPFYLNTMARPRGLSYASGRGQRRGQLIPEANYLAWVKIMTLRRPLINPQVRLWVIMTIQQPPHQFTVVNNHTQPPNSIQNQSSRCNNCPHLRGLVINDNDSS